VSLGSRTLERLAKDFATDLTRTVRAVVGPDCPPFIADTPEAPGANVAVVRQEPAAGITLLAGDDPVLTLTVEFQCTWDGHMQFLAVHWSRIAVYPQDDISTNPLVRYEYVKDMRSGLPAAHLQVHGTHEALTDTLRAAGVASVRGRRRVKAVAKGRVPALAELHFPLGGHRFRPCLEDILEVLMEEFGVTPAGDRAAALEALADGRETWRRTQVAAAVRDAPDEAIRVLQDLGYDVTLRDGATEPQPQTARLRAL
jgi:hypothetical protein